jgi:hypothetical protein
MGIQPANQAENAQGPEPKVIQIEVPGNGAIYYFEGGVRSAIEVMEANRRFMQNCGNEDAMSGLSEALTSMYALLDVTREVKTDIIKEYQQRAVAQSLAAQGIAPDQEQEDQVQANFVPKVKGDDDENEEGPLNAEKPS